jgi:rhodanese-related sulfurtransferase
MKLQTPKNKSHPAGAGPNTTWRPLRFGASPGFGIWRLGFLRGLVLAVSVAAAITLIAAEQKFKSVGVDEFDKLRKQTNTVVLDVRTPKEFTAGHIPGATNIDWYASDFEKRVSGLDKSKTYLVHCAAGRRSASAAEKLSGLRFTNVYNLEGGMKEWEKAAKPVQK